MFPFIVIGVEGDPVKLVAINAPLRMKVPPTVKLTTRELSPFSVILTTLHGVTVSFMSTPSPFTF